MSRIAKAESYLLEQIRRGSQSAWAQLVERYQGRLLSFARAKLPQRADCEDIIQETFVAFLKTMNAFRQDCSLETYLFALLRRKIVDTYRKKNSANICLIQDVYHNSDGEKDVDAFNAVAATDPPVSWYARRDEQLVAQRQILADALTELLSGYKKSLGFQELKIIEMIFYCQLPNKDIAKILNLNQNHIAVTKHRSLKQVHKFIEGANFSFEPDSADFENLLTELWRLKRLSCPKRSTVGAYLLGTLEKDWHDYVDFHLNTVGCYFCRANLEDLKRQTAESKSDALYDRIMESTVGFLRKP